LFEASSSIGANQWDILIAAPFHGVYLACKSKREKLFFASPECALDDSISVQETPSFEYETCVERRKPSTRKTIQTHHNGIFPLTSRIESDEQVLQYCS